MTPATQEGLPALATDEREVEDLMRVILRAWKPCVSQQGHPHMEWAEIAARAIHKERVARLEAAESDRDMWKSRAEAAVMVGRMAIGRVRCQCETPLIRCDDRGCRCTMCGKPERFEEAKSHDD